MSRGTCGGTIGRRGPAASARVPGRCRLLPTTPSRQALLRRVPCYPRRMADTSLRSQGARPMSGAVVVSLLDPAARHPARHHRPVPAGPADVAPRARRDRVARRQLTLSALIFCFGLSQLVWGPLSDRFGRRPVLLGGLAPTRSPRIGSALAPSSIGVLIVWRTLQGAAMGAAVMCARAIVRDLYAPHEGARVMSRALTGLGVIACISAPLGGGFSSRPSAGAPRCSRWRCSAPRRWRWSPGASTKRVPRHNPDALRPRDAGRHLVRGASPTRPSWPGRALRLHLRRAVHLPRRLVLRLHRGARRAAATRTAVMFRRCRSPTSCGTFLCRRLLPRHGVRGAVRAAPGSTLAGGTAHGRAGLAGVHDGLGDRCCRVRCS